LERPVNALLVVGLLLSAMKAFGPVRLISAALAMPLIPVPNTSMALSLPVLIRLTVPVLLSAAAVTVVDALRAVLPMVRVPLLFSVPPRVTVLPPLPLKILSTPTVPVLVSPPAMFNAACTAPFFPTRSIVPALLRLVAVTVLVAPRLTLPISKLAPALLVNVPPRVSELPPPPPVKDPSTLTRPVLVRPTPVVVTDGPPSTRKVPALLERPVSALLVVGLLLSAMKAFGPVRLISAPLAMPLIPVPNTSMALSLPVLIRLTVPVLLSAAAVTVVDAPRPVLPMVRVPLLVSVPPRVTALPPLPLKILSTPTVPVLVRPPAMFNPACTAPFFPTRSIVPALLRLVAVTVLVAPRLTLPISKLAPALLVNVPPRVSELPPPPPVKDPSTLTRPVLVRPTPVVVTDGPPSTRKVPALLERPVNALLVVGLLLSAMKAFGPVRLISAALAMPLIPVPNTSMALSLPVLIRLTVPVLLSAAAVTVVDALRAVLPMVRVPLLFSVPPRVTVLPPLPLKILSTPTVPVLVSPPAMFNAACTAPFFPTRSIVPALLRLVAVTVLVAPRLTLPISKLAPALLVNVPPRVSELPPPPPVKDPSTLTRPVLVRFPVRVAAALMPVRLHAPGLLTVTLPTVIALVSWGSPLEMVAS